MITYIEKGAGLHDAIEAAGHKLSRVNGQLVASNEQAVQAIIDAYPIESYRQELIDNVDRLANERRDKLTAKFAAMEVANWPIKRAEAIAYIASRNAADAPKLVKEAADRGIGILALCQKVLAKSDALADLEAKISGVAGRHSDAIKAAATWEELRNYDWRTDA